MTNAQQLPPWGQMDALVLGIMRSRPIPEAWRPTSAGNREQQWQAWRDSLIADLESLLWPTYEPARTWSRQPDPALIDADFKLMDSLKNQLDEPIRGRAAVETKHRVLFDEEDDDYLLFGHKYERYDAGLPQYLRDGLTHILWNGYDRKLGSLHLQLKQVFQRPRPYQVAYLEHREFEHLRSRLAATPSLVSGHCLQGCLAGVSAYVLFGTSIDFASVEVLGQFTVDIGDRRVFAGVHYPSDNLSSWYTTLKLLPHVIDHSVLAS
ncbi:MAG TPA: phosphatase PAP2 family protein, partial [Nitrospiraceae bacterium]|nr:phosphatase PAP2 family protein [Nitrospiraceae bacterium]